MNWGIIALLNCNLDSANYESVYFFSKNQMCAYLFANKTQECDKPKVTVYILWIKGQLIILSYI